MSDRPAPSQSASPTRRIGGRRARRGRPSPFAAPGATRFFVDTEEGRRIWAASRRFADRFGAHLVCPRRACRRAHHCTEEDRSQLPLCSRLYRGEIRFALAFVELASRRAPRSSDGAQSPPAPRTTFLEFLASLGASMGNLHRPADWRGEEWTWENDPEAVAFRHRVRAALEEPDPRGDDEAAA